MIKYGYILLLILSIWLPFFKFSMLALGVPCFWFCIDPVEKTGDNGQAAACSSQTKEEVVVGIVNNHTEQNLYLPLQKSLCACHAFHIMHFTVFF